jgi:hypothetical protein
MLVFPVGSNGVDVHPSHVVAQIIDNHRVRCFVPSLLRAECWWRRMYAPTGTDDMTSAAGRLDLILLPAALLASVVPVRHA